jgi:multimeric flavodoxin WrbA
MVLVINGSIRSNGNTDILVNKLVEGSTKTGVHIKLTELRKKDITNCIGCYRCVNGSTCSLQDDMTGIRDDIGNAELLILASPLYWWGVTGLMKTFIDRLFFYYYPRNRGFISGKNAVIVTPMAEHDVTSVADLLTEFYKRLWNRLEVNIVEMVFFGGLMDRRTVLERPEYLEQVYALGAD